MRLDWRYVIMALLVGLAVCSVVGAVTGVWTALSAGAGFGTVIGSGLAGLIIGLALGCLLGPLSGVAATFAVSMSLNDEGKAFRAAAGVGATYLVALTLLAALDYGRGWQAPSLTDWAGVVLPAVAAAALTLPAARQLED